MRSDTEVIGGGAILDTWAPGSSARRVLAKPLKLSGPSTPDSLGARIRLACAGKTCGEVSEATGYCAESVRRYRKGDPPPAGFILKLARVNEISVDWLLIGRGPRLRSEVCESELSRLPLARVLTELTRRQESESEGVSAAAGKVEG